MSSTFTVNKGIEQPASGDYVNSWAAPVNANWEDVDNALGGVTGISVTSVAGPTIALTLTQYQPPNFKFTGVLSANLLYYIPAGVGGLWTISNATTGSFSLSFGIAAGNSLVLGPGRTLIVSDGANVFIACSSYSGTLTVSNSETGSGSDLYADFSNLVDADLQVVVSQVGASNKFAKVSPVVAVPLLLGNFAGAKISDSAGSYHNAGYLGLPFNVQSTNYTLALSDRDQAVDATANISVTAPAGVFSQNNTNVIIVGYTGVVTVIQGAGVTLQWAGNGSATGNRTLTGPGIATIIWFSSTVAMITGVGLT